MTGIEKLDRREFRSADALRRWLRTNHRKAGSFWLVTYKKHCAEDYLAYDAVVEELLCFGWIDSRTRRLDDDRTMLLVGPRQPGGTWSASNKRRVQKLLDEGRISPAGQAVIDAAKFDGAWTWLDDVENLVVPADLEAALANDREASANFEAFNAAAKKVILLWIKTAKREATRAKRIDETVRLAAINVKAAHPEASGR